MNIKLSNLFLALFVVSFAGTTVHAMQTRKALEIAENIVSAADESKIDVVLTIFKPHFKKGESDNYLKALDGYFPFSNLPVTDRVLDLTHWENIICSTYDIVRDRNSTVSPIKQSPKQKIRYIIPQKVELVSLFALGLAGGWFLNYWWNSK